jgi:hypothetical protein
MMVIIAFAPKSSKILPNIFCKNFKHCAVIVPDENGFVMHQFVAHKNIVQIPVTGRDIKILGAHGWRFVYVPCELHQPFPPNVFTCVGLAKYAVKFRSPFIFTPDALYKAIKD